MRNSLVHPSHAFFLGSSVFIYGSSDIRKSRPDTDLFAGGFRPEYGSYTLTLDNQTVSGNAHSRSPSVGLLGSFTGLSETSHHLHLANIGLGMDVDQIVFQTRSAWSLSGRSFAHATSSPATASGKAAFVSQRDEAE